MTLFDFEETSEKAWTVVNDGVMGGNSKGYVDFENGALVFTGTLVTEGGGFTTARARQSFDLGGYEGLELRVRGGGGRSFQLEVVDGAARTDLSRRAPFQTSEAWQTVRIPFDALEASFRGRSVQAPPLDRGDVQRIGLYIADGQDGPFQLEVDAIRAYRAAEQP